MKSPAFAVVIAALLSVGLAVPTLAQDKTQSPSQPSTASADPSQTDSAPANPSPRDTADATSATANAPRE
ncbi:MAG TPA: hypothetical protein VFB04_04465, partial [Terriglobales bacterium]|nr:hypothetical protein [Terriglobales bacterium]